MAVQPAFHPSPRLFATSAALARLLARPFCHLRVEGLEHRPDTPFVAIFNHASTLDVVAMAHVVPGPVCFWAKAEIREMPLVGAWLGACGAVFVKRGKGDEEAFGEALARLRDGLPFFLAPEGTRHHGEEGGRPRTGFVRLALQAGVPVLPCAISGAREALPPGGCWPRLFPRRLVRVLVGRPILLPQPVAGQDPREALAALAAELMETVYRMKAELDAEEGA